MGWCYDYKNEYKKNEYKKEDYKKDDYDKKDYDKDHGYGKDNKRRDCK
jgi:hypothetical protein